MTGTPRRLWLGAVAGLALLAAAPAWAETLSEALVSAYRHSALLDQNRAVLRAADEDVASAMSALRPVLAWSIAHDFKSIDGLETNTTTASLVGSMTLYDFGRNQLAIDIAKETVMATRESLKSVEQSVLLQTVQAYLNVRSAEQQVALQQNSVRLLGEERQAARDRFEVGEITSTDVSTADAQLAATRAGLVAAQGSLQSAREAYKLATGKYPGKLSAPPPLPKLPKSVAAAQSIAQRQHPTLRQSQRTVAAAELGVAAAAAERGPSLSAQASVGKMRGPNSFTGATEDRDVATLGITLNQTLYAGGKLSAVHRKAMAQRDSARSSLLNTARTLNQTVADAWASIDVARAQIKALDQQISAAQLAYDGTREEASLGARTTLDVLSAEQKLLSAKSDKISAQANLQLAHYQLLAAMGLLTVEDLKLGIPTYDPSAYYNAVRDAPSTSVQGKSLDRVMRATGKTP